MVQKINPTRDYNLSTWDTVVIQPDLHDGETTFDWAIEGDGPGLDANASLHSTVIICLFTDRRAPADFDLPYDGNDRRGWFGDFVDVDENAGETEVGSLIWLYHRSVINEDIADRIKYAAEDSLDTLIRQGAVARVEVEREFSVQDQWIKLTVNLFSQDGDLKYSQRFNRNWLQIQPELA